MQANKREENPTWFDSTATAVGRRRIETTAKHGCMHASPSVLAYFHHTQVVHKYARACLPPRLTSENELDGSEGMEEGYKGVVPGARHPTRRFSERTHARIRFKGAST